MTSRKSIAIIRIDNSIDLITNSSSELFLISADQAKDTLLELVNAALKGYTRVDELEPRIFEGDHNITEESWMLNQALEQFPEDARAELKEKYFSKPKYYAIVFDRDWESEMNYEPKRILENLGFKMVNSDY